MLASAVSTVVHVLSILNLGSLYVDDRTLLENESGQERPIEWSISIINQRSLLVNKKEGALVVTRRR